jgi:hypothetical protein
MGQRAHSIRLPERDRATVKRWRCQQAKRSLNRRTVVRRSPLHTPASQNQASALLARALTAEGGSITKDQIKAPASPVGPFATASHDATLRCDKLPCQTVR